MTSCDYSLVTKGDKCKAKLKMTIRCQSGKIYKCCLRHKKFIISKIEDDDKLIVIEHNGKKSKTHLNIDKFDCFLL
jgi:hypothetical protein